MEFQTGLDPLKRKGNKKGGNDEGLKAGRCSQSSARNSKPWEAEAERTDRGESAKDPKNPSRFPAPNPPKFAGKCEVGKCQSLINHELIGTK